MRDKLISGAASLALACISSMLQAAEAPLRMTGGLYTVSAQVNRSATLEFLVDSGSSVVVIPNLLLEQLLQNGTVTRGDIIGSGSAFLADSSHYPALGVRLREIQIGDAVVPDVVATVIDGVEYPLLGQTFLGRFSSVTFDNHRHVLVLSGSPSSQLIPTTSAIPFFQGSSAPNLGEYSASGYPYGYAYPYGYGYSSSVPGYGAYPRQ